MCRKRIESLKKPSGALIGKGGLYGNVIRTGLMLNLTKDHVDELIKALDAGIALCLRKSNFEIQLREQR